ncbi:MAG: hypothetical protein VKL60_12695, partial [Sphaerospermopsis sp.]|nr:hypothetical protein [Sphaerospermopsis sp.]
DSCTGVREACWKHQHSENRLGQKLIISRPNASPLPLLTPDSYALTERLSQQPLFRFRLNNVGSVNSVLKHCRIW